MLTVRKKDKIKVLSGKEKGKTGEILKVFPREGKVLVSQINLVTKHAKARGAQPGGIQKKEAPLPIGKVMLICPKCEQPMRPKFDRLASGEKVRLCRRCNEVLV